MKYFGGRAETCGLDWGVERVMGNKEKSRITSRILTWTTEGLMSYPLLKWERLEEKVLEFGSKRRNEELERKRFWLDQLAHCWLNLQSNPTKLFLFFTWGCWNSGRLNNVSKDTQQGSAGAGVSATVSSSRVHTCHSYTPLPPSTERRRFEYRFCLSQPLSPVCKTRQIPLTA